MTDEMLKDSRKSSHLKEEEVASETIPKKPRTSEDFYLFCKFILEYENYDLTKKEASQEVRDASEFQEVKVENEMEDGSKSNTSHEPHSSVVEMSSDDDSYDLVTCFCQKPFAGRPMIECSRCLTWIHLRCAKVKKSEIPDVFICSSCKERNDVE